MVMFAIVSGIGLIPGTYACSMNTFRDMRSLKLIQSYTQGEITCALGIKDTFGIEFYGMLDLGHPHRW